MRQVDTVVCPCIASNRSDQNRNDKILSISTVELDDGHIALDQFAPAPLQNL